jgi:molybdopterin synthase sulfur carrier subunit
MSGRTIHVLYFAWLRERIGRSEEALELPETVGTVATLVAWLCERGDNYRRAFSVPGVVRCAVNQVFATPDTEVSNGDEVAFFPPVTGG